MSIEKVAKVCTRVTDLTWGEINDAVHTAEQQANYVHPLKMKTAGDAQRRGKHNLNVLQKLKELKAALEEGADD